MLSSFLLSLREGLEAALVIGIVLGVLRQLQRADCARIVWAGVGCAGVAGGLATAALLAWLLFATTLRLDVRRFFTVTSILLVLFAGGLVAKGVHEFNEVGWVPSLGDPVWNSHALLNGHSAIGTVARTLFGYTSHPSLAAVVGYAGYLAVVSIVALTAARRRRTPVAWPADRKPADVGTPSPA